MRSVIRSCDRGGGERGKALSSDDDTEPRSCSWRKAGYFVEDRYIGTSGSNPVRIMNSHSIIWDLCSNT